MHVSLNNCFQTNSEINDTAPLVENRTWEMRLSLDVHNPTLLCTSFLILVLSRTVLALLFSCTISFDSCGPKVISKIKGALGTFAAAATK